MSGYATESHVQVGTRRYNLITYIRKFVDFIACMYECTNRDKN